MDAQRERAKELRGRDRQRELERIDRAEAGAEGTLSKIKEVTRTHDMDFSLGIGR